MGIAQRARVSFCLFVFLFLIEVDMNAKENEVDYEVFVDEVIASSSKMINTELGLTCIGTGGQMPRDVEGISMKFMCNQPNTIDEARKKELMITQVLLKNINSHEKLRAYLREFPFKSDRVQVSISFFDEDTGDYLNGVAYASLVKGEIVYYRFDKEADDLIEIAIEPYEEALKKTIN